MPKWTEAEMDRRVEEGGVCGPAEIVSLTQAGGLTQFGAAIETLPPGSSSSIPHWHAEEDELVYVLAGQLVLIEGAQEVPLSVGEAATFKAGASLGHALVNRSDAPARVLVVGTRAARDVVTYPEAGRLLHRDRETGESRWTDLAGNPAGNLYME